MSGSAIRLLSTRFLALRRPSFADLCTWRALGLFWAGLLSCLGILAIVLQVLGPPPTPRLAVSAPAPGPGPIAVPDPALLEPLPGDPGRALPRIGPDGRTPMAAYAAWFAGGTAPRISLIIASVGLDHVASETAIRDLPSGITLAISPYAHDVAPVLVAARARGDEMLVSIPMEPASGLDDPGDHALLGKLTQAENARRLDWALSRMEGYVGATGALGRLRGERFASQPDLLDPVLATISKRGLLYVDPRPSATRPPGVAARSVDLIIDDSGAASAIDAQLAELVGIAKARGSAVGLVGGVRPVAMARLLTWTHTLAQQGVVLAPITAVLDHSQ